MTEAKKKPPVMKEILEGSDTLVLDEEKIEDDTKIFLFIEEEEEKHQ